MAISRRDLGVALELRALELERGELPEAPAEIARLLALSQRTLRRWMGRLERVGLLERAWRGGPPPRRVVRLRIPSTPAPVVSAPPSVAPPAVTPPPADPEWRQLRARLGGVERALREVQGQRDEAQARVRELERQAGRAAREDASAAVLGELLADLRHAVGCRGCPRCTAIARRHLDGRPPSARAAAVRDELLERELLRAGSEALLRAMRDPGVGSRRRVVASAHALEAALAGDERRATQLLAALDR